MSCPDCNKGSVLAGVPTGSMTSIGGMEAYVARAIALEATTKPTNFAVVLLSDVFGLPLVNIKVMADKFARELGCDVWIPDLFNGDPVFKVEGMESRVSQQRANYWPLWDKVRFYILIITRLGALIRNRASVVDPRTTKFIRTIREEQKYDRVGGVGYCFGGALAVRLAPSKVLDSIVICHPGPLSEAEINAVKIPASWVCAEDDSIFPTKLRMKAEAIFASHKDTDGFVPYEFVDYKGTAHGFACRPTFAFQDVKEAFEKSMEQTSAWMRKTLAE